MANYMRGKKGRPLKVEDFIPNWGPRRPQSWQDMLAAVKAWNTRLGGEDRRGRTQ